MYKFRFSLYITEKHRNPLEINFNTPITKSEMMNTEKNTN